jgi:hypothetical protein
LMLHRARRQNVWQQLSVLGTSQKVSGGPERGRGDRQSGDKLYLKRA